MSSHRLTPFVALTAALVLSVAYTDPAPAAGVATFRLMNIDPAGAAPVTSVLARIKPPGTVVARDVSHDPSTILPESSGYLSSGFDPDALEVGLIDGSTSGGDPFQIIKLDFGPAGLAPGGKLFFQLNKAPNYSGDVTLLLPESVTNLALESLDHIPPVKSGGGGSQQPQQTKPPGVQVPEPAAALLWAGLAGALGLLRVRAYRRARALA